jgi:membrane protein
MRNQFVFLGRVLFQAGKRFLADKGTYRASALTVTSLLALVPLLGVSLSIFSLFPMFKAIQPKLQAFIFENFLVTSGKSIQVYLEQFVGQISHLSLFTLLFLFVTAILLLFTIEKTFNAVWRVRKPRRFLSAFLLYWAVLTLLPILFGVSFVISSAVTALHWGMETMLAVEGFIRLLSPFGFLLAWIGFSFLYIAMPNCRVPFKAGLVAGLVSTLLFSFGKIIFSLYIYYFPTYQLIYGAFSVIPLFFLWIYVSWIVTLYGAEVSYVFAMGDLPKHQKMATPFEFALNGLKALFEAQQAGQGISLIDWVKVNTKTPVLQPEMVVHVLLQENIICETKSHYYHLAVDLHTLSFYDLYQRLPWKFPTQTQGLYLKPRATASKLALG